MNVSQWKHVSGMNNPADIGTRLINIEELRQSEWFTGQAWLCESEENWPKEVPLALASDDDAIPLFVLAMQLDLNPKLNGIDSVTSFD